MRCLDSLRVTLPCLWLATLAAAGLPAAGLPAAVRAAESPAAAAEDATEVRGGIPPEAVGRWLVVMRLRLMTVDAGGNESSEPREGAVKFLKLTQTGGGEVPVVRTWEIRAPGESAVFALHRGRLPDELRREIAPPGLAGQAAAGRESGDPKSRAGTPDARILAEVDRLWPGLAEQGADGSTVASRISTRGAASEQDQVHIDATDAHLLIVTDERTPEIKGYVQNVTTYAVTEIAPDRLAGRVGRTMLLPPRKQGDFAVPPLPVVLEGDFVAYRVQAAAPAGSQPAKASLLGRLLAVFSGCGRR